MAFTATIFKAELQIADMDRNHYADHALTLARHPSETDERMMVRLLAFALHASEALQFTKGLCADDEPALWERNARELERLDNLRVFDLPQEATRALAGLVTRTMHLQCTVQEGQVWLGNAEATVLIEPRCLLGER